jgi:aldehyde dehydrogenase (NAD+)
MNAIELPEEALAEKVQEILTALHLDKVNSGSCYGHNSWSTVSSHEVFDSDNPANGHRIAQVAASSEADYEQVVTIAQKAFATWRTVPAPVRGELVRRIGDKLREYKDPLGSLVALEMGKIKQEGDGEVQEMIDIADFAVGQSRMLYGKTMHSERPSHRMYEQWHPYGVTGVISAFNFPVAVWSWNAFIAAICGNTVIWKPSPKAALCAIAVQHICNEVMHEMGYDGIFTLFIPNQNSLVEQFVKDKRVPLVSFTGSSAVGHLVSEWVAQRLGRSILELSGNNAIIVDNTADIDMAVPAIVFGAVGTTGQRCTTTRRVIVHESIKDLLVAKLVNAYKQVRIGNPLDEQVLMGPLIDAGAVESYKKRIQEIEKEGGDILCGGRLIESEGFYVEPTIVSAQPDFESVQTETFAPILYVLTFKTLEEAIQIQNNVPQGLSSAIFTESMRNAETFLSATGSDCGIANVNIGTSGAEIGGAFGGEKETGGGREAGSDSWKAYMRRQTNTINWSHELPLAQGIKFNL